MSNPGEAVAPESNTTGFAQEVETVVKQLEEGPDGNWVFPADLDVSEEVRYAATLEKRRRDTQSALSTSRRELTASNTIVTQLEQRVAAKLSLSITPEEQEVLDTLKLDDPDEWRKRVNDLEQKANDSFREELGTITTEASHKAELAMRAQTLATFNEAHPDGPITDEQLAQDIPPRIVAKLERGECTFEEFLNEAHTYLTAPRKVAVEQSTAPPSLGTAGGSNSPGDHAVSSTAVTSYEHELY